MQVIASYLMYLPRWYITCLTLLSKLSGKERGRTYYINIQTTSFFKQRVYKQEKYIYAIKWKKKLYGHNNNNYLDEYVPIMCFDPRKITFFVMIFFKFTQNPVGNLIFCITSLTTLLCCSVNIHGIEFILTSSPLLWNWMTYFFASFHNFIFLPP